METYKKHIKEKFMIVLKYSNRKLYSKKDAKYVTVKELYNRVKEGQNFQVIDYKTGLDITKNVLTSCIKYANLSEEQLKTLLRV